MTNTAKAAAVMSTRASSGGASISTWYPRHLSRQRHVIPAKLDPLRFDMVEVVPAYRADIVGHKWIGLASDEEGEGGPVWQRM